MATRGRKSAASAAVSALAAPAVSTAVRIPAPMHLTDAEQLVWNTVVGDQPAGAFTDTHTPMLEMYCRHVVQGGLLRDEILNFDRAWLADSDGLFRYDKLLKMHERETRAASSLATRLRITRQAVEHPATVGRKNAIEAPKGRKPWEMALPSK